MQLLSSCPMSAPFQEEAHSVFSVPSLWGTGKHREVVGAQPVFQPPVILHWTCSSMSKPSCSVGLTSPAWKGRIVSLDPAGCAVANAARPLLRGHVAGSSSTCCLPRPPSPLFFFFSSPIFNLFNLSHALLCGPYLQCLLFLHRIPYWTVSISSVSPMHLDRNVPGSLFP